MSKLQEVKDCEDYLFLRHVWMLCCFYAVLVMAAEAGEEQGKIKQICLFGLVARFLRLPVSRYTTAESLPTSEDSQVSNVELGGLFEREYVVPPPTAR